MMKLATILLASVLSIACHAHYGFDFTLGAREILADALCLAYAYGALVIMTK